ncbi:substrate-binding domain-containing protein [Chitinibacter sp. FCG-7]|uniref:Substrate-binding domain-containing protein n=1 Tax=Chitinibacter mangrovi TaxID=3153927 RepID=A0AAU7F788_9NEIS
MSLINWCCFVLLVFVLMTMAQAETAKPAVAASKAPWPQSVGVSVSSLANPFFVALTRGAHERARQQNPAVKWIVRAAEYSVANQQAQIQELIKLKVDVILLSASSEHALEKVLLQARKQGIVVIGVDVRATGAQQTVLTDNFAAGQLVCDYLARRINGKGRVVIQNGPQVSSVIDRVAGCKQAWLNYPKIQLLSDKENGDGSVWGGHTAMQAAISRYGEVDAVFTINDRQALGSAQALQKAGHHKTRIGSVDGSHAVVQAIAGNSPIVVTASQSPKMIGQHAIEMALALHQGGAAEPELLLLGTTLVTRDNASTFEAWDASATKE